MKKAISLFITFGIFLSFFLAGCGGGSSGSQSVDSGGTGQVALMVTDGPSDDFDHIWIKITRVLLLPSGGGPQVVIHEDQAPDPIDLLDLRAEGEDDAGYLLALGDVPVGSYDKIRLEVDSVQGEKDSNVTDFKLSSGKIDLNPRGPIFVEPGIALSVTLDIDCDKSIHYANNTGNGPSFRPVVFVDIRRTDSIWHCPRVIRGTIANPTDLGFEMLTASGEHRINVILDENAMIMNAGGDAVDQNELITGSIVNVRGVLDTDGLHASLIILGEVDHLKGVVTQAVADGVFEIDRYPQDSQAGTISVALAGQALILFGCDQSVDPDAIQPGMLAHVYGRYDLDGFKALAVVLRANEIVGEITAVFEVADDATLSTIGHNLTVTVNPDSAAPIEETVFLPEDNPLKIQLDGQLPLSDLTALVGCGIFPTVKIHVDPNIPDPLTVMSATILPQPRYATVTAAVDLTNQVIPTDIGDILVTQNTYFFDFRPGIAWQDGVQPGLMDIEPGDALLLFGLPACDGDFTVTTVLILPSSTV